MPFKPGEVIEAIVDADATLFQDTSWSVALLDTHGRLEYGYNPDESMPAASFNKLSAAYALDRTGLSLDTEVRIEPSDRRGGNGILQYAPEGHRLHLGEAAELALKISDNTALRIVMRSLGGPAKVNDILSDRSPRDGKHALPLDCTLFLPADAYQAKGSTTPEIADRSFDSPTGVFTQGTTNALESAMLLRRVLEVPRFRTALEHSNYGGGLRGEIDPLAPTPLAQRLHQRWAILKHDIEYLQAHSDGPPTAYPGKEGTIIDSEEHLRHHAVQIGKRTVSVMTESAPYEYTPSRPEAHHVRVQQGKIGAIIKLSSQAK